MEGGLQILNGLSVKIVVFLKSIIIEQKDSFIVKIVNKYMINKLLNMDIHIMEFY